MFFNGFPKIVFLYSFPNLSQLVIINQSITVIENLDMCSNLVSLWICECDISVIEGLDQCCQIRNLYLYDNKIRKIENLYTLRLLEILWLNNNKIECIEGLNELVILLELNLAGNTIKSIGNSLRNNISMEKLDLSGNQLESTDDLLRLSKLPKLKYLIVNGPDYLPNPVLGHTNYFLFLIYHFPHLKRLDTFDVSSAYLRDIVVNIINKKRLFYTMKIGSLQRDTAFMKLQLRLSCSRRCEQAKSRLSELRKLTKLMEISPNQHTIDPWEIQRKVNRVQSNFERYHAELEFYLQKVDRRHSEIKSLFQREFSSCGNFKFELSVDKIWVNLCNELINSRFCNSEFGMNAFRRIRTHRVIKLKDFHNEANYEKSIQHFLDQADAREQLATGDDCRLQDYLFLVVGDGIGDGIGDANDDGGLMRILDSVYSCSDGRAVIRLTNSLFHGDLWRASRRDPPDEVQYGRVVMVKVFSGFLTTDESDLSAIASDGPNNSPYDTWRIPTRLCDHRNTCSCSNYKYDWYFRSNKLLVPEYVVDYEYVLGEQQQQQEALSPLYHILHGIANDQSACDALGDTDQREIEAMRRQLTVDNDAGQENPLAMLCLNGGTLVTITVLDLTNARLKSVAEIATLPSLSQLIMPFNDLTTVADIANDTLTIVDVSFNRIGTLSDMHRLPALVRLDVGHNLLVDLREEVATLESQLPQLQRLDVRRNAFRQPASVRWRIVGVLRGLKILDDVEIGDDEVKAAQQFVAQSRISPGKIATYGRTDTARPRSLLIDDLAATLLAHSDNVVPLPLSDQPRLHRITSLCLDGQSLCSMAGLEPLVNLRFLSLANNLVSRIEGLDHCVQLEELTLDGNSIRTIENLARLQKLRKLSVNDNRVDSVAYLRNLPHMQVVSLHTNRVTSFVGMECCHALVELYAANNGIRDSSEILLLRGLCQLALVDLHHNPISAASDQHHYRLNMIFTLKHLRALDGVCVDSAEVCQSKDVLGGRLSLDFIGDKIGSDDYGALTELDLSGCGLKSVDLAPVDKLHNLCSLNLENNQLTSFSGLVSMHRLRVLCLNSNAIESLLCRPSKTAVPALTPKCDRVNLTSLEVLHLGYNNIRSISQLGLHEIPSLRALFLQGNDIATVDGLDGLVRLRELVLDQNRIKHVAENSLAHNADLREIHLDDNRLRNVTGLFQLKSLTRLYLVNNRIADLHDLDLFRCLQGLVDTSLHGNPVARRHQHRGYLMQLVPSLLMIDGIEVTDDERLRLEMSLDDNSDCNMLPGILNQSTKMPNAKIANPNLLLGSDCLRADLQSKKRSTAMNYYNFNNKTNSIQLVANSKTIYFYDPISQIESIPRLNFNKRK